MRLTDKKQKKAEIEKCPWEGRFLNWPNGQQREKVRPKGTEKERQAANIYMYFKT